MCNSDGNHTLIYILVSTLKTNSTFEIECVILTSTKTKLTQVSVVPSTGPGGGSKPHRSASVGVAGSEGSKRSCGRDQDQYGRVARETECGSYERGKSLRSCTNYPNDFEHHTDVLYVEICLYLDVSITT